MESLGQLAGGVAHDFNNLLGAILNYASFVADELDAAVEGDSDRPWANVRRDVAQIQAAAELATRLTHQLLAFARREVVRPRVLSLNKVVTELEQMLRRTLGEQVELSIHLAPELWMCLADPGQMEQVLMNLVVNARDAMPDGGRLSIDTHDQEVDEAYAAGRSELPTGRYIRLRVSDTGSGMSPDVLERAFEPFFSMKPKGEGSGLGLATVYGIVRQAGGYAQIYSEVGLGTTFTALLPATELSPAEDDVVPRESSAEGGETVLLVEDGAFMRDVATRILTRHGYQVIAAASGPDAIEAAARHTGEIQLLLTDVVMPKMLGKEVAERIVASRPAIRVLFMSGYAQPVLGSKGTLEPGVTLLEKPFSKVLLLSTVRAVLDAA
jgi:CheY-like chemotaxis protein